MKAARLLGLVAVLVVCASVASAGKVTGLGTNGSYGLYDGLYQWEIGTDAASSRQLGKVALGVGGLIGHELRPGTYTADVAALSDGRVAVAHRDATDVKFQVSVLTPIYDGAGLLTGATVDATFDQEPTVQGSRIAPLPDGGFVTVADNSAASCYAQTGPNTWVATQRSLSNNVVYDVAGLISPVGPEFAVGHYSRESYRYDVTTAGHLAKYDNGAGTNPWAGVGEGLRSPLLTNGWLAGGAGDWGNNRPTVVLDGTEMDGGTYPGVLGEITNSDGTSIMEKPWAALADGRVVTVWSSGWMRNDTTFRVYDLVNDPGGRMGTVGANGEAFEAILGAGVGGDTFVGVVSGDYMVPPPAAPIAEPGALSLVGIGLLALRRKRMRAVRNLLVAAVLVGALAVSASAGVVDIKLDCQIAMSNPVEPGWTPITGNERHDTGTALVLDGGITAGSTAWSTMSGRYRSGTGNLTGFNDDLLIDFMNPNGYTTSGFEFRNIPIGDYVFSVVSGDPDYPIKPDEIQLDGATVSLVGYDKNAPDLAALTTEFAITVVQHPSENTDRGRITIFDTDTSNTNDGKLAGLMLTTAPAAPIAEPGSAVLLLLGGALVRRKRSG